MAARQPYWILNNIGYHINEKTCSARYSSDTTSGIVMNLHTCIGLGLYVVLNEIHSDWKNKMAARQPSWIFVSLVKDVGAIIVAEWKERKYTFLEK